MFTSSPSSSSFRSIFSPNNMINNPCEASSSSSSPSSSSSHTSRSTMPNPLSFSSGSGSAAGSPSSAWSVSPTQAGPPSMSYRSRESTVESPDCPSPSSSRSRHGNGFWTSLLHHGKNVQREVENTEDELMKVDTVGDSYSFTSPPSKPICSLSAAFQDSETSDFIPPSFYPGQSIPVILTFELDRFSSLPHYLNPTLSMSLIGTLHLPGESPRTIICVSVSLSEGLALWARDAQATYISSPPGHGECSIDPTYGLPGGTYSLPLTVQVPSTPRLPPTFTVRSSSFAVTYALTVTLSCDDPSFLNTGTRLVLADTAKPFEMMPETLPTRPPRYAPSSFFVKTDLPIESTFNPPVEGQSLPILPRQNAKWTIHPSIPTTTYSPTSVIPLSLSLTPPPLTDLQSSIPAGYQALQPIVQVLVRLSLVRREHSSLSKQEPLDNQGNGLVVEEEINSRWGWFESSSEDEIKLKDVALPLMPNGSHTWKHGMSTVLNVGPSVNSQEKAVCVSSSFHVNVTLAFLSLTPGSPSLLDYLPAGFSNISSISELDTIEIPRLGEFSAKSSSPTNKEYFNIGRFKRYFPGTVKTTPLPIVIGSVSEPREAMHNIRWSDLHLSRSPTTGREVGRMIHGESLSNENGWMVPPPCYDDAIKTAPYEFKVE